MFADTDTIEPARAVALITRRLRWAIAATLILSMPLGIVAVVYAVEAGEHGRSGRQDDATRAAKRAKAWTLASAMVGLAFWLAFVLGG